MLLIILEICIRELCLLWHHSSPYNLHRTQMHATITIETVDTIAYLLDWETTQTASNWTESLQAWVQIRVIIAIVIYSSGIITMTVHKIQQQIKNGIQYNPSSQQFLQSVNICKLERKLLLNPFFALQLSYPPPFPYNPDNCWCNRGT